MEKIGWKKQRRKAWVCSWRRQKTTYYQGNLETAFWQLKNREVNIVWKTLTFTCLVAVQCETLQINYSEEGSTNLTTQIVVLHCFVALRKKQNMPSEVMILLSEEVTLSIFLQRRVFSWAFHQPPAQLFWAICALWFVLLPARGHSPRSVMWDTGKANGPSMRYKENAWLASTQENWTVALQVTCCSGTHVVGFTFQLQYRCLL